MTVLSKVSPGRLLFSDGQLRQPLRGIFPDGLDSGLLAATLVLVSLGIVMVASSSISFAAQYGDGLYFLKRHLLYVVLSVGLALAVLNTPMDFWYRRSAWLLAAAVLMLVLVLIPGIGREINGSRRWLPLGPLTLQVSEVVKLAMVVFTAAYLQRRQSQLKVQWQGFAKPLAVLAVLVALLLMQPDFGSSVVLAGTVLAMLFLAGVSLWQFTLLLLAGLTALIAAALSSPYRVERLVAYLDPWADQFDSGYQLTQSLIAFGRGEWFGVGLGNSVQKLFYLPEAHTDFVFAIFAEEFGWLGVVIVIAVFVVLVARIFSNGREAAKRQDWFGAHVAFGIGILIAGQAFINIGVTSGLLPTKGLTLPFVSYGGSSLLVSSAMLAMVLRVGVEMEQMARVSQQIKRERLGT